MTLSRRPFGPFSVAPLGVSGSYGIDAEGVERAFHELGVNYFFITSKDDVPAERSERDMVDAASEPKDEQVYDGDANGTDLFAGPHAAELEQRLIEFLERA